jgi:magnesium chelatase subunit D
MPEERGGLLHRLEPALLAAAITPGLRSILLYDADRVILDAVADMLEQALSLATSRIVVPRYLGSGLQEDDLWICPALSAEDGRLSVTLRPGVLGGRLDETHLPLLIIPDLAELSLAAARGGVALIGADVAHLERHGASQQWLPDGCWLAACDRAAIGKVSPHLLDRFALRLGAESRLSLEERIEDVRRSALGKSIPTHRLSPTTTRRLIAAAALRPEISAGTLDRVVDVQASGASPRRDIALSRLAVACSRLEGSDTPVEQRHVEQAALLLGMPLPRTNSEPPGPQVGPEGTDADAAEHSSDPPVRSDESPNGVGDHAALPDDRSPVSPGDVAEVDVTISERAQRAVMVSDDPEALASADLPEELAGPYPEDHAIKERDITALREPPTRSQAATVPRGSIVGVQQARDVRDLALINTVLTAAIWWPYRRTYADDRPDDGRLRLLPSDLRSYRRALAPEQLLALVIDYTCLEGWDWTASLLPFLRRAYVERAGIVLVRVGARDSANEMRADRLATRNLLDPRLDVAMAARPGRATPLAHGLFLALQALQHGLQHGEGHVRRARLVVVTDGRGNVPLELDDDLSVVRTVGRIGIENALDVAASIRAIAAIETFLVDPEPDIYPELVSELAQALGAELVPGRSHSSADKLKATP